MIARGKRGRWRMTAGVVTLSALTVAGITGCSGWGGGGKTNSPTAIVTPAKKPVIVNLATLDGTIVEVPLGRTLDIIPTNGEVSGWSASIQPNGIASFQDGSTSGGFSTNPGITPLEAGSGTVTLTRQSKKVVFHLTVSASSEK